MPRQTASRTLDSSKTLVASNARVPILSYELIDEEPSYPKIKDAIAAAQARDYVLHDVVFLNVPNREKPEPRAGVLLYDPKYAYDGNVVRSGLVVARDYQHQGGQHFRTFRLGRNCAADLASPLELASEENRCIVREGHLGNSDSDHGSLTEAVAAAETRGLFLYELAFFNSSHGGSPTNEPMPILLLAGEIPPKYETGDGFITRVGNRHNLYRWGSHGAHITE